MMKTLRAIVIAGLLVGLSASTAAAGHGPPDRAVPIGGSIVGLDTPPDFEDPECLAAGATWRFESSGTGTLSHLGRVEFDLVNCTTWSPPPEGDFGLEIAGTMTFTAANGDMLVIAHEAAGVFVPGAATVPWEITEWVVDRGTGRFAGATGSGVGNAVTYIPQTETETAHTEIDLSGEIAYDASNRSRRP